MSTGAASSRLPFPGLRSFRREESDLFFGREDCINVMVDRLAATRFLAVLGSSGTGKSSVVKTGLLDGLDLGLMATAGSSWRVVDFRPGSAPLRNLARRLLETSGKAAEAGADVRMGVAVTGLRHENGRVAGVKVEDPNGDRELRARLVVGADGRNSSVARFSGARRYNVVPNQRALSPVEAARRSDEPSVSICR